MSSRLDGKVCLITGAGSGMGRLATVRFAQEGAKVVACDLNADGTVDDTDLTLWMNAFDLVIP